MGFLETHQTGTFAEGFSPKTIERIVSDVWANDRLSDPQLWLRLHLRGRLRVLELRGPASSQTATTERARERTWTWTQSSAHRIRSTAATAAVGFPTFRPAPEHRFRSQGLAEEHPSAMLFRLPPCLRSRSPLRGFGSWIRLRRPMTTSVVVLVRFGSALRLSASIVEPLRSRRQISTLRRRVWPELRASCLEPLTRSTSATWTRVPGMSRSTRLGPFASWTGFPRPLRQTATRTRTTELGANRRNEEAPRCKKSICRT